MLLPVGDVQDGTTGAAPLCVPQASDQMSYMDFDVRAQGLTRISHQLSTSAADPGMSTALCSVGLLDVLSSTPASPSSRAPCIHARLRRLATKSGEKCGLESARKGHVSRDAPRTFLPPSRKFSRFDEPFFRQIPREMARMSDCYERR